MQEEQTQELCEPPKWTQVDLIIFAALFEAVINFTLVEAQNDLQFKVFNRSGNFENSCR